MKWSIGRILYVTMLFCLLFGVMSIFRGQAALSIGLIVLPLAVTSVGSYFSKRWRKELLGYAVFGWTYLAIILYADLPGDNGEFVYLCWLLGLLAALAMRLIPNDHN